MKKSAYDLAQEQLSAAAAYLQLEPQVFEILKEPMSQLTVRFPVRLDNGTVRIFTGFRFQHNTALGPSRGGTRFHPEETEGDVKALALWMTLKNALNDIPNGGAKGGVVVDPDTLSQGELERLSRAYIRAISPVIGAWKDFPGADIGTTSQTQSWMLDEWETLNRQHEAGGISGKSLVLGGSLGRPEATSRGLLFATRQVAKVLGLDMNSLSAIVQGFGKVGWHLARLYAENGVRVLGVSDVQGGVYNPAGLDIPELRRFVDENGKLAGFPGSKSLSNAAILEADCDILAPCAVQNVLTADNAGRIKAKIIVEGANGPTSAEAEKILSARGVFIAPDIWANSGGTQVAHFERVQNLYDDRWSEAEVNARLEKLIVRVFEQVYRLSREKQISLRLACWVQAVEKVIEGMKARGWV